MSGYHPLCSVRSSAHVRGKCASLRLEHMQQKLLRRFARLIMPAARRKS